jgi:putative ABC transport system substrate-binding protein
VKRRAFITLIGGAAAWPLRAHSQKQMARVGVLMDVAENNSASKGWADAFEAQLGVAGWQKRRNVEIIYRWGASDAERLARYAEELVRSAPDVSWFMARPL